MKPARSMGASVFSGRRPFRLEIRKLVASRSVSSHNAPRTDLVNPGQRCQAIGHRIANAAAEGVHHVFFRMAIGREVDPLATPALAA